MVIVGAMAKGGWGIEQCGQGRPIAFCIGLVQTTNDLVLLAAFQNV